MTADINWPVVAVLDSHQNEYRIGSPGWDPFSRRYRDVVGMNQTGGSPLTYVIDFSDGVQIRIQSDAELFTIGDTENHG